MRQWLRDRPWIWIVVLMVLLLVGSAATLIIAELNKPEILRRSEVSSGDSRGGRSIRPVSSRRVGLL